MTSGSRPVAVRTVDLGQPLSPVEDVGRYSRVRLFVTDGGDLLGAVDIHPAGTSTISAARLRDAIAEWLGQAIFVRDIARHLVTASSAAPRLNESMTISIVVPTCDRPDELRRCLASLVAQTTIHRVEIVVVDNRPGARSTRQVVEAFPGVRLIEERRPGLSFARNAGIAQARGDIIVATDDDVIAPAGWIEKLAAPFVRAEVAAVTGNVLPLELESQSQQLFEAYGGLGKGFARLEVNGDWFRAHRLAVPTWQLGATANAAFRAAIFRDPAIGLLEESLGAGMPAGCSEDTYLFYKLLKAGHTLVYEPSAFVWHRHRTSMESLEHQILAYSRGHVAYHLLTLLRDGDRRALARLLYSLPRTYARRIWQRLRGRSEYPISLILLELRGTMEGPWALWRSRRRVRELGASKPLGSRMAAQEEVRHVVPVESRSAEGSTAEPPVAPMARLPR